VTALVSSGHPATSGRSQRVNANLTKGAARTGEVIQLLRLWNAEECAQEFCQRVVEGNLLGKMSRGRLADLTKSVFLRRYVPGGNPSVGRRLAHLAHAGLRREALDLLLYYHAALAEHLLYLVATELLYELRGKGQSRVSAADVERFLSRLEDEGWAPSYSASVARKLGQANLTALRDFGILVGKSRKRIASPTLPHEVTAYLCYHLREEGSSARRIVGHRDWRLFLLHPQEAEQAVLAAASQGHFVYRSAGDIKRFDWKHDSLDDYVRFLTEAAAH